MVSEDMHEELKQLRAEVAALSTSRANKLAAAANLDSAPVEQQPGSEELIDILEKARIAVGDDVELKSHFDQLFEQLEHEIKDLPAITTLAVFSLGVLFGRLLR